MMCAGINSRALTTLFEVAGAEGQRRAVSLSVSYLEVYNEAVRDLLVKEAGSLEVSGIPAGQLSPGAT
jgi:Kinesin motor domain